MTAYGWQYLTSTDKGQLLRGVREGNAYGGPYHVEIHPADRCNIDCFFCSTAAIRGTDELPAQRLESLLDELRAAGTRSIRFSGGGEPLFHRRIDDVLRAVRRSAIPIENLTTNAVLINDDVAELLTETCDQVTISLNTGNARSYAAMMQTPERNFDRVLTNIGRLRASRARTRKRRPLINVQFLVWRDNYRQIPQMYDLARDAGADTVLFSGLSFLRPDQRMSDDETAEMLRLYEEMIRRDEFRHITNIGSFERDLTGPIDEMIRRLAGERRRRSLLDRITTAVLHPDSLLEKLKHHREMQRRRYADAEIAGFPEACIIGWYSMLVRSTGVVTPCCILQHKSVGSIAQQTVRDVWYGDAYQRFRRELTRIIARREEWQPSDEATVEAVCGVAGSERCPMKSFYYVRDTRFTRKLRPIFDEHVDRYTRSS